MKNKDDISFTKANILKWQDKFRLLVDWDINYEEEEFHDSSSYYYNGQLSYDPKTKRASIYPCPAGEDVDHYIFHELLHCAMKCVNNRETEETLVRDLCKITFPSVFA